MAELLIEIYSEEIPARMQQKAVEDFKKIFSEFFLKQNICINNCVILIIFRSMRI